MASVFKRLLPLKIRWTIWLPVYSFINLLYPIAEQKSPQISSTAPGFWWLTITPSQIHRDPHRHPANAFLASLVVAFHRRFPSSGTQDVASFGHFSGCIRLTSTGQFQLSQFTILSTWVKEVIKRSIPLHRRNLQCCVPFPSVRPSLDFCN